MKKLLALLVMVLMFDGAALAAQRGTPDYEALKTYKRQQSEEKKTRKANPSSNAKGFWAREAERSGFAGTGAMFTNAISNAIPLDGPNSSKQSS